MSEVLNPKVGDSVRLVNEQGAEVIGVLASSVGTGDWHEWRFEGLAQPFYDDGGWSVAEIFEKPLPPIGSFVRGFIVDDDAFVGVVAAEGRLRYLLDDSFGYECDLSKVASYEVIS